MPRKKRSDSAAAHINAMKAAASPLPEKPAHVRLRDKDQPFWVDIMRSRAREEWLPSDLTVAAQLARCQADIEVESEALEIEGSVVTNARQTQVMNPRHSVLQQLAQREMSLMRCLAMGGAAVKGNRRDLVNARQLQNNAEATHAEVAMEELLA